MKQTYLAIQHTPETFEMGIFIDNKLIDTIDDDKRQTSKLCIPHLEQLLSKNGISFTELSFCAVNCGPGPFSTLRSIIATMNGLHAATHIPLMGIDGLAATFSEFYDPAYENTLVILNAFNDESYYLIAHGVTVIATGYKKTALLMQEIVQQFPANTLNIIDNKQVSIETIAKLGNEKFIAEHMPATGYLMPLHLKKHAVERIDNS